MTDIRNYIKGLKLNRLITIIIVALVISGLEILGEMLDVLSEYQKGLRNSFLGMKQLLILGAKGFAIWIVISVVMLLLWKLGKNIYNGSATKCFLFKRQFYVWIAILVSWIPCFLAYFPGIYSYDGEPQLIQYTTGQFDNHHPVLHTLILGWCYDLGQWLIANGIEIDGITFYSILQMMLLAFALSSVVMYLVKKNVGKWFIWCTMGIFVLFPTTPVMAISTTKDTAFTSFFVLLIVKLLEAINQKTVAKKDYIWMGIYAVCCMLLRRNACYVFLIILVVLAIAELIKFIKTKAFVWTFFSKLLVVIVVSYIAFSVSEKAIMYSTNAIQGESAEALSIPLMQIARAYKSNQDPVTDKYGEVLFSYITQLGLNNYRPLISDGVKQGFNNELFGTDKASFFKMYVQMFFDYPGSYIQAFLYMTKGDWQLMDNSHCEVYKDWWRDRTGYLITDATPVFAQNYVTKSDLLPGIRSLYESIVTDCSYRTFWPIQLLFAPAVYVFSVVICGIVLIMQKRKNKFFIWLFVGLYLLTIIAGPCVLVRYIFPLMMLSPMLASMIFEEKA